MKIAFLKSILHNMGVVAVGLGLAFLCTKIEVLFGIHDFSYRWTTIIAYLLILIGFSIRVWATFYFYTLRMKVIVLVPQKTLITSGPYRFSRHPLYLGGNVFIFFGAALLFGSPSALFLIALHLPLMDRMAQREEKQLEITFGEEWVRYKNRVPRWF